MGIIQTILFAAITAFTNNNANAQTSDIDISNWSNNTDERIRELKKRKPFHNVVRLCKSGRLMYIAQHFSHNSHSSHSSHSSHYSASGGIVGGSPRTSTSVNSSYSASGTTRESNNETRIQRKVGTYRLGDTNLKKGDYGKDVQELIALLKDQELLIKHTPKMKKGFPVFDEKVEKAVKTLQKQFHMVEDGVVTKTFVDRLKGLKKKAN